MKRPCAARRALVVAAGLVTAGAQAADQPLWELGLGAAWVHLPHYRGSDQSRDWLLPVPYAVYRGEILRANRDGARAVLLDSERFDFDISVSASAPTRSSDNRAREGMADLAATVEVGPNLNSTLARGAFWKLDLRLPVHAVFTVQGKPRTIGWTASPVINLDLQWAGWNLGVQGGPRWASRRYHGFYYDVDTADATAVRPAYAAQGGYAGWRLMAGASRRLADFWLGAFVRADGVGGAVFDASPLVRQRHNLTYGLALSWVFSTSDERVAGRD
ncbi:MAG TPA: MipA/OmpV family protein [Rubrivivax sp.]|nr:MipA/OmpV family protein [Rubrivivax sp.]